MNNAQKAKAQQYFELYPDESVIHQTSDGQMFLQSNFNDAVNHQRSLTRVDSSAALTSYFKKDLDLPTDEELLADELGKQEAEEAAAKKAEQEAEEAAKKAEEQQVPAAQIDAEAEQPTDLVAPAAEEKSSAKDSKKGESKKK